MRPFQLIADNEAIYLKVPKETAPGLSQSRVGILVQPHAALRAPILTTD